MISRWIADHGRGALSLLLSLVAVGILATWAAQAQQEAASPPSAPAAAPTETHDDRVPAGAVRSYIDHCRTGDYERAASYLNLARVPAGERATAGPRLARQLKVVLDRKLWVDYATLSDEPAGRVDDGLPSELDRLGSFTTEDLGDVEIRLERVVSTDGERVWKIASSTVERIPRLYEAYGYGPLAEFLPEPLFAVRVLDMELWQWIGLLVLVLAAWILSWLIARILLTAIGPFARRTATELDDEILGLAASPLRLAIALGLVAAGQAGLGLAVPVQAFLLRLLQAMVVITVAWLAIRMVDLAAAVVAGRLERRDARSAVAVVPLGSRAVKVFLGAIALIVLLQNLGLNVGGLIAGLGVGGIALALAAQKTIENLFGGVSVIADQPVRVGDFCRFADGQVGTVEEIGLRSTRIRTLGRTLVSIPNADFSQRQLENFAARDRIHLHAVLGLLYETTPDQLRWVLAELRKLLLSHPRVLEDPARVRFVNFGAYSLDLELFAYIDTSDWNEFLKIREDLYLRFMDIVERSGTGFAFPSQTLYLGRDGGVDAERTERAAGEVRRWRERGELPFPDFPEGTAARLSGSADYPPNGSATPRSDR